MKLAELCTGNHYLYSNWYSDTYRVLVKTEEGESSKNIVHISIPFDTSKEQALMERYGITADELDAYYMTFANNLKHSWKVEDYLKARGNDQIDSIVCYRDSISVIPKENGPGSDIFILTEATEQFSFGTVTEQGGKILDILELFHKMVQMARLIADVGVNIRTLDIDSLCVDGEGNLKYSSFLFSSMNDQQAMVTKDFSLRMRKQVREDMDGPFEADVHNLCTLLWSLLSGQHWTIMPNYTVLPMYAPGNLGKVLQDTLISSKIDIKKLLTAVIEAKKLCEDRYICFDPPIGGINTFTPMVHFGDTLKEGPNQEEGARGADDKKTLYKKITVGAVTTVVLALIIIFVTLPMAGVNILHHSRNTSSSADGIYTLNGIVVDKDAEQLTDYIISEEGCIVRVKTGKTEYEKEYVSPYPVIQSIKTELTKDVFETYPSISDYPYRDGVIILPDGYSFDKNIGTIILPADLGADIRESSYIVADGTALRVTDTEKWISEGSEYITVSAVTTDESKLRQGSSKQISAAVESDENYKELGDKYLKGKWTKTYLISREPEDSLNNNVYITGLSEDLNVELNGEKVSEETTVNLKENAELAVSSVKEGTYTINIKAEIGNTEETLRIVFHNPVRTPEEPEDTKPIEMPKPTSTPAPSEAPLVQSYIKEQTETTEVPVTTVEPTQFSISTESLTMSSGAQETVVTSGDDGGYIQVYSTDESIATVSVMSGLDGAYTVSAVGTGSCEIVFWTLNTTLTVNVNVY